MPPSTRRTIRWIPLSVIVLFVLAQFVPVDRSNPPSDPRQSLVATHEPPQAVATVLERTCHDCHSNDTKWPWYSRVAPASWLVARDVHTGRSHMNFSEWARLDTRRRARRLDEICDAVTDGWMPLGNYLRLHPNARLTPTEIEAVCGWARREAAALTSAPTPDR